MLGCWRVGLQPVEVEGWSIGRSGSGSGRLVYARRCRGPQFPMCAQGAIEGHGTGVFGLVTKSMPYRSR